MMDRKQLAKLRADLLANEISKQGLSTIARLAKKPPSQIADMAKGRKTFGDPVSKEIGPLIRPDLPRDWLVFPEPLSELIHPLTLNEPPAAPYILDTTKKSKRTTRTESINALLDKTDEEGLAVMLHEAEKVAAQYPRAKQTPASYQ